MEQTSAQNEKIVAQLKAEVLKLDTENKQLKQNVSSSAVTETQIRQLAEKVKTQNAMLTALEKDRKELQAICLRLKEEVKEKETKGNELKLQSEKLSKLKEQNRKLRQQLTKNVEMNFGLEKPKSPLSAELTMSRTRSSSQSLLKIDKNLHDEPQGDIKFDGANKSIEYKYAVVCVILTLLYCLDFLSFALFFLVFVHL